MGHKIEKRDRVYLANIPELSNGKGWHGLGITPKAFTAEELQEILFEHIVVPAGIMLPDGNFHPTGELYACSSDDGLPIGGTVSERWARPSNKRLFEMYENSLLGSNFEIVSCGTVENRAQFFVDARQKETVRAGGRDIANYFGLHSGFGGKTSTCFSGHNTVIQCANTTALFLAEAMKNEGVIKAKNTLNIEDKLPGIQKAIELQIGVAGEFARAMEAAAKIKIDARSAKEAYIGTLRTVLPVPVKELKTRTANRVNRLTELFATGDGNGGENLADFYSGFTQYFTRESATSEDEEKKEEINEQRRAKQWFSSEFGTSRAVKQEFHGFLFGDMQAVTAGKKKPDTLSNIGGAFNKLRDMGRELIEKTEDKEILALLA